MAYSVSADFKTAIKDQTSAKSCLILFDDLFFSTSDFTDSGVVFNQFYNTSDDLTFGDCPSDTLSFSVVANGALAGYSFGKCRAYLGVQTDSQPYAFGSINAHIEVVAYTWTASDTGLYCDGTQIDNGEYVSLVSDGTWVYAVGLSSSYRAKIDGSEGAAWTPNRFIARKLRTPLSAVFSANTAYVWDGTNVLKYEYVPMGVYLAEKPRSTVGDTVVVQDAYDQMKLFDADASQFLASLSYPKTLSQIYTSLCSWVGVTYASSTFTYSSTSYASSPFSDTACTLRDILWWIAERARAVAHFNRVGQLALMTISTTVRETLTAQDIGADGYSIAEFQTPQVTGVLLRGDNGSTLSFGTMETPYVISANPFVSTITNTDLQAYWAIPTYIPIELQVLEADPSVDVGDLIDVKPMIEEIALLTDVYGQVYVEPVALTNPDTGNVLRNPSTQNVIARLEALAVESPIFSVPLMERTITFIGAIRAKYVATGNEVREADISNTEYNASVSAKMAEDNIDKSLTQQDVFNRLTNNGQAQGIFLDSNGDLYVNGTWIQAHTISADKISITDLSAFNATIGAFTIDSDSIHSGTKGSGTANGDITLTTSTFNRSIGGTNRSNLKFAIGGNFGVAQDGSVYMSNATVTGGLVNITATGATVSALSVDYTYSGNNQNYMSMLSASQITHKVTASNGSYDIAYLNKDALVFGSAGANGSNYAEYGSYLSDGFGIADHSGHGLFVQCPSNAYIYMQPVQVSSW